MLFLPCQTRQERKLLHGGRRKHFPFTGVKTLLREALIEGADPFTSHFFQITSVTVGSHHFEALKGGVSV